MSTETLTDRTPADDYDRWSLAVTQGVDAPFVLFAPGYLVLDSAYEAGLFEVFQTAVGFTFQPKRGVPVEIASEIVLARSYVETLVKIYRSDSL